MPVTVRPFPKTWGGSEGSFEFAARGGLFGADAAGDDVGFEVVFAENGRAGETAEHGDLADVSERVGDGSLKEAFGGAVKRFGGGEIVVEFFYGGIEAVDFRVPGKGRGVMPRLLTFRGGESPIKEVAHVGEDLRGSARFVADVETGEVLGRATKGFAGAVGDSGETVAEELAGGIGRVGHGDDSLLRQMCEERVLTQSSQRAQRT
jgi:hypothetical protein